MQSSSACYTFPSFPFFLLYYIDSFASKRNGKSIHDFSFRYCAQQSVKDHYGTLGQTGQTGQTGQEQAKSRPSENFLVEFCKLYFREQFPPLNSFPHSIVFAATIQFMKQKIAIMRKLYENFNIFTFKKEQFPRKLFAEIRYVIKYIIFFLIYHFL